MRSGLGAFQGKQRQRNEALAIGVSSLLTALVLLLFSGVVVLVFSRGLAHFWPSSVAKIDFRVDGNDRVQYVEVIDKGTQDSPWLVRGALAERLGGATFSLEAEQVRSVDETIEVARIELLDGRFQLARVVSLSAPNRASIAASELAQVLSDVGAIEQRISDILNGPMAQLHQDLVDYNQRGVADDAPARTRRMREYHRINQQVEDMRRTQADFLLHIAAANGNSYALPLAKVRRVDFPNQLSGSQKLAVFFANIWAFISDSPKQANQAGGVFPALFGTLVMVLLMTVLVTPVGVLVAVYLSEYAPRNTLTSLIRIGVNNLAGVPSVVYGVFGLGFFVYAVGGELDALFFSEQLPSPTFGAPGLFWASLTMALLTLPVVIVATEEGLRRVPRDLRMGSYALGATKYETLFRTVLPIASPGIMTGVILAIARGAGEVAPLILVGAVKFAPQLPVDGTFPFFHLDRQFMHLGVLIYDGAYLGQEPGQGSPLMYATCALLLLLVLCLNLIAIGVRSRLRRQFRALTGLETR